MIAGILTFAATNWLATAKARIRERPTKTSEVDMPLTLAHCPAALRYLEGEHRLRDLTGGRIGDRRRGPLEYQ